MMIIIQTVVDDTLVRVYEEDEEKEPDISIEEIDNKIVEPVLEENLPPIEEDEEEESPDDLEFPGDVKVDFESEGDLI